jgi:hypothetical protein
MPEMAYFKHQSIPFCLSFFVNHFPFWYFLYQVRILPNMPLLCYFCIIIRKELFTLVTTIVIHENIVFATPQSGCNTSLLQFQVIQFRALTKLLRFRMWTNCCNSSHIRSCCNSRQIIATLSKLFVVATSNIAH